MGEVLLKQETGAEERKSWKCPCDASLPRREGQLFTFTQGINDDVHTQGLTFHRSNKSKANFQRTERLVAQAEKQICV